MADRSAPGHVRPNIGWADLSPLQRDVTKLVAEGLTNGVIAHRLGKANSHIARVVNVLYVKSGVSPGDVRQRGTRDRLTRWAIALLESEEKSV